MQPSRRRLGALTHHARCNGIMGTSLVAAGVFSVIDHPGPPDIALASACPFAARLLHRTQMPGAGPIGAKTRGLNRCRCHLATAVRASWPGLSGPSPSARTAIVGPDKPGHDAGVTGAAILTPMRRRSRQRRIGPMSRRSMRAWGEPTRPRLPMRRRNRFWDRP
jgi:hypothetical protein